MAASELARLTGLGKLFHVEQFGLFHGSAMQPIGYLVWGRAEADIEKPDFSVEG